MPKPQPMLKVYAYGHDYGNSETGGVVISGKDILQQTIPSAVALGDPRVLQSLDVALSSGDYVFQMEGDSNAYFIGNLALSQGKEPVSDRGNIKRYQSINSVRCLLVNAAALIKRKAFGLHVVTGLPMETYKDATTAREEVIRALSGTRRFSLNGEQYTVEVTCDRVLPEGSGSSITGGASGSAMHAVIDIGGRTTDLYVSKGLQPQAAYCVGTPLGVESACDLLIQMVKAKHGRVLRPEETRLIMRALCGAGKMPEISYNGQDLDVFPLANAALQEIGSQILSWVAARWNSNERGDVGSEFKTISCIGGGAYYFASYLRTRIPHLTFVEAPELVNAMGYATFAHAQLVKLQKQQAAAS